MPLVQLFATAELMMTTIRRGSSTREEFIAFYVARARAVGFDIEATEDGCIYAPDEDNPEIRMIAEPCDCGINFRY